MTKRKIEAKIIADSIDKRGNRIISYILTYPRFIHSELMTHRMFSRNAASSRAIPFEKMAKMVKEDPFIPIAWQKHHKGMQGTEYLTENDWYDYSKEKTFPMEELGFQPEGSDGVSEALGLAEYYWAGTHPTDESALNGVIDAATNLYQMGVTKQICNRLLEPFMWYTSLVTATEFDNFFELRCPKYEFTTAENSIVEHEYTKTVTKINRYRSWKDACRDIPLDTEPDLLTKLKHSVSGAEIHIQALAEAMWDARNESTPKQLKSGEWHIPFRGSGFTTNGIDCNDINSQITEEEHIKIATARSARLSYMTFDGEIDYEKDIKLHDMLLESGHMSPFEHVAKCMDQHEYSYFVKGKLSDQGCERESYDGGYEESVGVLDEVQGWCNNFRGFIPYRYMIE